MTEIETETYNIIVEKEKAIDAYLAQVSPDRGNGNYQIDIPRGMFKLYNVDTRDVEPHFMQNGNYYPPENQIDEFGICEFFDEKYIDSNADFDYSGLSDEELETAIEYNREVVSNATLTEVIAEDYVQDDIVIRRVVYKIIWE